MVDNKDQQVLTEQDINDILGIGEHNPFNAASGEDQDTPATETPVTLPSLPEKKEATDNAEVRERYQQSRADKLARENAELKARLDLSKKEEAPEEEEEFPPPPDEPETPFGFSEQDARSDPNSESAKYVRQYGKWQADMLKYNTLFTQYAQLKHKEELAALRSRLEEEDNARKASAQRNEQVNTIKRELSDKYKLEPAIADDFINIMSDPANFNLENQVKFYMMLKGIPAEGGKQNPNFNQATNARQFGSPMVGINLPAAQPNTGKTEDDLIMDQLVNLENKNNWTAPRKQ